MRSKPTAPCRVCSVCAVSTPGRGSSCKRAARLTPLSRAVAAAWLLAGPLALHAQAPLPPSTLPRGLQVSAGQASVATQGAQMTVRNSPGAILNWQGFSIGAQAGVRFEQANAASKVLNRVTGQDPSQILGSLTSNGQVWLLNPNGVLFGQGARVDVASLVASTLRLNDNDFLAGRYRYSAADGTGTVRNEGSLRSAFGGQVVLLGERVENSGDISAPGGQVTLAAARSVELVDTGLPNLSVRVQVPAGESLNLGRLMADGGTVNVYGAIVNQQGLVQADTLGLDAQGRIVLKAADTLTLGETSRTQAVGAADGTRGGSVDLLGAQVGVLGQAVVDVSGAAGGGSTRLGGGLQGKDSSVPNARAVYLGPQATLRADATGERGSGGSIILWSDQATRAYGTLSAHGARLGGDGGFVETSGGWLDARPARVDVTAAAGRGGIPGTWLLDPNDIRIVSVGAADTNISGGPNFTSTNDNSIITTATLAAALNAGNSVSVVTAASGTNAQAGDILMDSATLSVNPGAAVTLTLQASRDVLVRNSTLTSTGQPLSLTLQSAGTGVGAIEISFSNITTAGGNITLRGTQSQQVPLPGGGVSAQAFPVAVGYDAQLQSLPSQLIQPQAGVVLYESQLNLGSGTFSAFGLGSLTAPNSVGIFVRDSSLTAANIALSGWSPAFSAAGLLMNGCGECGGARITATQSLALQGGGQDGVRMEGDAKLELNAPGNPAASLSIKGEGTQLGVVVDRSDFNTQISVVGGSLTIDGRSTDTTAAGTAVLITDTTGGPSTTVVDLGSAAGMQITGGAGSSAGVGVAISNLGITGPAGGTSTIAAAPGRLLLDQLVLTGAGAYNLRGEGISISNSQLTGAAGLNLQTTVSAATGRAGHIEVNASSLNTSAANAALRLEAVGGAAAQGDPAFAGGAGISLLDSTFGGAGAGSTIVLTGEGSSSIGEGVVFGRTPMTATNIAITGRALFDSHGVLSDDLTGGAASVLTATNLSISGTSANNPAAPSRVGVLLGNAVELRLSGRGSASISGDSVVLGDGAGTQPFLALGDAATFTVSSIDSQRVRNALLDFSGGTGTNVTLRADSDNLAGGRVRLDQASVRTGGGNFSASGVGVRRSATTVPSNTTSADGALGVFPTGASIDAGGGTVTITGVAPNDGNAQVGVPGNSGVGFGGTSAISGSAITISGDGGDRGRGVDVGVTVPGAVLNLTANQIAVSGRGADFDPSSGLAYEGVVLNSGGTLASAWLVNAGGSLNVTSTNSGMSVSGVNFDAGSMILRSDGKLNLANSTLDTSGDLSLLAQGSAGGSGNSLLGVSSTALTAGGLLQINGQASDAGTGVALLRGSYSGRQVSVVGTSSGGLGLGLVDIVGTPGITATLAGVSLVGSSGGTGTGVSFTGNWAVQSPTDISILTENGLPLLANDSGQRPTFNAGQRFLLENFSPLGLVVGPSLALDGALLSGALAGMAPTATATLRATGSANPLTVRGPITVPSRLAIQADGIELQPGALLTSTAPGDAVVLGGTASANAVSMLNTAGAGVLSTPNGRWVVRASDPRQTTLGGLVGAFTAYNLAAQPWATDAAGNLITPLPGNALGYAVATAAVAGQGLAGVQTRVYDSTTLLTLNPSTWALTGLVPGDSLVLSGVTAAQLADKNVGTAKPVTLDAGSLFAVNDALGRPVFGYGTPTFTANITPLSLPISGASVTPKVYDSTVVASLASLGGVTPLAGDSVAVGGTVVANFSDKNVGIAKPVVASGFVPTGADAANYLLLPPTGLVGNITPRALAVSGLVANNKVYDASVQAVISGSATVNPLAGDNVVPAGSARGSFANKNVGSAKPVLVTGLSLAGADAANYTLQPPAGLVADITPATLAVTGLAGVARVYDGSTVAPLVGTAAVLPFSGDRVTLAGTATGSFATRNAGVARPITVLGLSMVGADAGNYNLLAPVGLVADITPALLGLAGVTAANRVYDGSTTASVSGTVAGQVAGDSVTLALSNAFFADRNVGTGKVVSYSAALAGADAANYLLASSTGSTFGNITPATLTYGATPVISAVGLTLPPLGGQVSGFVAGDTLSNSTSGLLAWTTPATSAGPAGIYAINGSGLAALNYQFAQASGNASALTLRASSANDPATNATTVATTSALVSVQVPLSMSTPTEGRVLDTTTTLTPTGAMATADGVAFRASTGSGEGGAPVLSGNAASAAAAAAADSRAALFATREVASGLAFLPLDFSSLPRDEVQTLLAARARYKQSVFSRSVYRLQQDPSLADVRACRNEFELSSGICVITEFIKEQIQAARATLAPSAQPHRELQRRVKQAALPSIERKMALLIGVNRYDDKEVPQLLGSVPDARAVRDLLDQKLGYETTVLENPTRASIIRAFNQLALDAEPNDSVIVYYAGHGVVVPINGVDTGFWLSSDVDSERPDTWLANADIARMVAAVGARQLMLVSDSCYSGALVGKERVQVSTPNDASAMLKRKAAVVMSSGGDEPVADQGKNGHSVFAWHFMRGLEGLDQWQVGGSIYERLRSAVFRDFPQTPQYGASRPAGHEGNTDFLFERRELEAAAPAVKTP